MPPPIASIDCGDWSFGKVVDAYLQFAESAGDAYIGRCLSGLDPNTTSAFLSYHLIGQFCPQLKRMMTLQLGWNACVIHLHVIIHPVLPGFVRL